MNPVTDPNILNALESSSPVPVTDPDIIKALETDEPIPVTDPELLSKLEETPVEKSSVSDLLPETLSVGFGEYTYDTGLSIPKEVSAGLVGVGYMMQDVYRGVKQIAGIDEEEEKANQSAINMLMADDKYGGWAMGGAVVGALVEPVGLLVPGSKGKSLATLVKHGAMVGGTFGVLGYVDEEGGQTRLGNAALGATFGAAIGGGIKAVRNVKAGRAANKLIQNIEDEYATRVAAGEKPKDVRNALMDANKTEIDSVFKETGKKPSLSMTQIEAQDQVKYNTSTSKLSNLNFGEVGKKTDNALGIIQTRVDKINKKVGGRLMQLEYNIHRKPHKQFEIADEFIKTRNKLSRPDVERFDTLLMNGKIDEATKLLATRIGTKEAQKTVKSMSKLFNDLGDDLYKHKLIGGKIENYFPRIVKDVKGLMKAMDKEGAEEILARTRELAKKLDVEVDELSPIQRGHIINGYLSQQGAKMRGKSAYQKERAFTEIPDKFKQYYAPLDETIHSYIRNSINDLERAKFFGKVIKNKGVMEDGQMNIKKSVGYLLEEEKKAGRVDEVGLQELQQLLNSRFGIGETSPSKINQGIKNLLYASLLGNPFSALTQLGDVGVAVYKNGWYNTAKGVVKTLTGQTKVKVKDFGLVDNLVEEFANGGGWTAKVMKKSFRYGGFESMDRFGKSVLIDGSLSKMKKAATSAKGRKRLFQKYGDMLEGSYDDFVDALQTGKITEDVRLALWSELSGVQPISKSQMPKWALDNPNYRMLYMFKSFMLKQVDLLRNTAFKKIKDGNVAGGLKDLFHYTVVVGSANTGAMQLKKTLAGDETAWDMEGTDIPLNTIKTFGYSEYAAKKFAKEGAVAGTIDLLMPPVDQFDEVYRAIKEENEDRQEVLLDQLEKKIPIVGRLYYYWMDNGIQKDFEKRIDKEIQKESELEE